jgi:hypothetical protein
VNTLERIVSLKSVENKIGSIVSFYTCHYSDSLFILVLLDDSAQEKTWDNAQMEIELLGSSFLKTVSVNIAKELQTILQSKSSKPSLETKNTPYNYVLIKVNQKSNESHYQIIGSLFALEIDKVLSNNIIFRSTIKSDVFLKFNDLKLFGNSRIVQKYNKVYNIADMRVSFKVKKCFKDLAPTLNLRFPLLLNLSSKTLNLPPNNKMESTEW